VPTKTTKRGPKPDRIAQLEAQVAVLAANLKSQPAAEAPIPEAPVKPGEYFVGGTDPASGKPLMVKKRWTRSDVVRAYPAVEFAPAISTIVSPHGVKPVWQLEIGKIVTVPSIVKDIHDAQLFAIRRQSEGYQVSENHAKAVFDAAKNDPLKGRHFEGMRHVGYGWNAEALAAAGRGLGDSAEEMSRIGWEPEVGFPGGYNGKPIGDGGRRL
jgi:hypothetical protein